MVKIFFVCRRREGLAVSDYRQMVLREHVPLALEHHRTMLRYEINLVAAVPPGAPETVSIPALCFESLADYQNRLYDTEEGHAAIETDAARFMGGADAYLTQEMVLTEGRPRGPIGHRTRGKKTLVLLQTRPGTTAGMLSQALETLAERGARLVLNPVSQRLSESGPDWNAFIELHDSIRAETIENLAGELVSRVACYPVDEYVEK